jgi:hypothetical protein
MGMACTICNHPSRLDIDRAVVQGQSYNSVARRFRIDSNSLAHHAHVHLSRQLVQAYEKKELTEGMNLLGRIDKLLLHAEQIFERNFNRRRDLVALRALAEQRCTIDMLARISMYLHEARAAELQAAQARDDAQAAQDEAEFITMMCDRLTTAEMEMWQRLAAKIRGETDEVVVPDHYGHDYSPPVILLSNSDEQVGADYSANHVLNNSERQQPAGDYSSNAILSSNEQQVTDPTPLRTRHATPRRTQYGLRHRSATAIPRPASNR